MVGASVLDLFFRDVEKYKTQPELLEPVIADSNESFFLVLRHSPKIIALKTADVIDVAITFTKVFAVNSANAIQTAALGLLGSANDFLNNLTGIQSAAIIDTNPTSSQDVDARLTRQ